MIRSVNAAGHAMPRAGMSVLALSLAAFVLPASERLRSPADDRYPWIDTLEAGEGAKPAGRRLMSLPSGLSRIDRAGERTLLIGMATGAREMNGQSR